MRILLQRVQKASVSIDEKIYSQIEKGILVYLGCHGDDTDEAISYLTHKIIHLRVFGEKLDASIQDIQGDILVVSQFTLYANCTKGRRPSFVEAARNDLAFEMYQRFVDRLSKNYPKVSTGKFGEDMQIESINDGPFTLFLER